MAKYQEFEGMKAKTIPVVQTIEYNNDPIEAEKNKEILKESIVDMFVYYFKNNLHKNEVANQQKDDVNGED